VQSLFNNLALQAGFVRRDEFDTLSARFEQAVQTLKTLEATIQAHKDTAHQNIKPESH
jgi:hypothetical protein